VASGQFADDPLRLLRIGVNDLLLQRAKLLVKNDPAGFLHRLVFQDLGDCRNGRKGHERGDESPVHNVPRTSVLQEVTKRPCQFAAVWLRRIIDEGQDRAIAPARLGRRRSERFQGSDLAKELRLGWKRSLAADNCAKPGGQPSPDLALEIITIVGLGKVGAIDGLARHTQEELLASGHHLNFDG